ncbi:hypothetical protein CFC21_036854 [Triticum aestivum]|uniref:Uncharacterized protein n=4 Tax=Triticum TaxID=4564 RepID=A0A9R1JP41_WHEAT|nr:uncharacterized protein LOC119272272 [Triticum dicoccoides]XP_044337384.1 uncharacterized protein LOC123058760 [Triticum aestivum]XP_048568289.1 uncharacterized protein LOC125548791 [Triticum urartu]VAH65745.1 unnamed protein product [Triticum turgidum subsp. durum]KAF7024519.1 hypothetical protein CFC21_036853 [Triticum aestivum]KAF7024520.1 hypothetical protein CFC21_036854 [Triticum aestivum]
MSQRPGRHQRRASQSVFSLPENFASLEDVPADGVGEQRKPAAAGADASEQQPARPAAGRHRRAMSMAVPSRDLDMIAEDMGSYKYGA